MFGGAGDDVYYVDDLGDTVREDGAAGADDGGLDWVFSLVDFTLGSFVENLTLQGTAGLSGHGNAAGNRIVGNGGANVLTGLGGADKLYGLAGADTLLGGDGNDLLSGGLGEDTLDGGAGNDTLNGGAGNDVLYGHNKGAPTADAGNDTLSGGEGNDTLVGGADTVDPMATPGQGDVAKFTATIATSAISLVASDVTIGSTTYTGIKGWSVNSGAEGTDTLVDVEIIEHGGGRTLLVGNGGFATIQQAVDEAQAGDIILIAEGTYTEQVVIDGLSNVSLIGVGAVTIKAPADVVETSRSSSDRETHAVVTVEDGSGVILQNITVDGDGRANTIDEGTGAGPAQYVGVFYRNASGGLEEVDIIGVRDPYAGGTTVDGYPVVSGNQRGVGLQVDNDTRLEFFMHGGSISDFQKNATAFNRADLDISGVTITGGGAQTINAQNGVQVTNSTGSIDGNTITDIGYAGPALAYSGMILAYNNTDLDITDNTITGPENGGIIPDVKTVGIFVYDFGPDVSSGGSITGNTISYVDAGIDVSGDITPNGIAINTNTITNLDLADPYSEGVGHYPVSTLTTAFTVEGSAQVDYLYGAAGADVLTGLAGEDVLVGEDGNDSLDGGDDSDDLFGMAGDDTLRGGAASDLLTGGTGADSIFGDAGDDEITWTIGDGNDTVAGGEDGETTGDTLVITANAAAQNSFTVQSGTVQIATGLTNETITHSELELIDLTGGSAEDLLTLYSGAPLVNFVAGAGDHDLFTWQPVSDTTALTVNLSATAAQTVKAGATTLATMSDVEWVWTGNGNDSITGSAEANVLNGNGGSDTIDGGDGNDTIDGGGGFDFLTGGGGSDTINGGGHDDTITGGAGADSLGGGVGNDLFLITDYADYAGDTINGENDADELRFAMEGGSAVNIVLTNSGAQVETVTIATGSFSTSIPTGTVGHNIDASAVDHGLTITANDGANSVIGTAFVDTITTRFGDDTITGGLGADDIHGGDGTDTFVWAWGDGADQVTGGTGSVAGEGFGIGDVLAMTGTAAGETFTVTGTTVAGSETVTYNTIERLQVNGGDGDDTIAVNALSTATKYEINGGTGARDLLTFAALGGVDGVAVNLATSSFASRASGSPSHSVTAVEDVTGSANADVIVGNLTANMLNGGAGNDTILGGGGGDTIEGGAGADELQGSAGVTDHFVYRTTAEGGDLINAFIATEDKLVIDNATDFSALPSTLTSANFAVANVAAGSYLGGSGDPMFVLDTNLSPGELRSLWYDADGNGADAVKIAEFDSSADLNGFGHATFLII